MTDDPAAASSLPDFQCLFQGAPDLVPTPGLVLTPDLVLTPGLVPTPGLHIATINDAYSRATMVERAAVVGRLCPQLRILLTTGYAARAAANGFHDIGGLDLLLKPFRKTELGRKLRELLAAPDGLDSGDPGSGERGQFHLTSDPLPPAGPPSPTNICASSGFQDQ